MDNRQEVPVRCLERAFRWCEENPTMATAVGAWVLSDLFAAAATLAGSLDVCVWYGQGVAGFFGFGVLTALADICFAWLLVRGLGWARIVGLVLLGWSLGTGVWGLLCLFGGLDNFFYDILFPLIMLVCDGVAFCCILREHCNPAQPAQKTAVLDWMVFAGYIFLCVVGAVVMVVNLPDDDELLDNMKQAAVEDGASAKKDLAAWLTENVEDMDEDSARESVEEYIQEAKAEQKAIEQKSKKTHNALQQRKNMRGKIFLYLFALFGPFALGGWFLNKYEAYKKGKSGTGEQVAENSPEENAPTTES